MSKHNIYLLTLGIITVFCIILGSAIHLTNFFNFNSYNEKGDFSDYAILEDFNSITIKGKVLEIEIAQGDEASFRVNCNKERLIPEFHMEGTELIIEQTNVGRLHGNSNCKVFITIPNHMPLKKLDIETNVGKIDISDISSDYIDITTNVGELKFENINFQELEGESNVGEISLEYNGLSGILDDFNISLNTNVGEVTVNGEKFKKSYNQKGETSKKINLCTNVGKIRVK